MLHPLHPPHRLLPALLCTLLSACAAHPAPPFASVPPSRPFEFDRDSDGIIDRFDRCPDEPEDVDGFQDEDGCTDPDNDRDGIPDVADKCPDEPEDTDGFRDADGCPDPDNDGDGRLDAVDRCPDEPEVWNGVDDEDGCPDRGRVLIPCDRYVILDKILFQQGSAAIDPTTISILDAIVAALMANRVIELMEVSGHSDGHSRRERSGTLGQARADVVRDYLVAHGVAPQRLRAVGRGSTMPLCREATEECWSKSRRAEFRILQQANGCDERRQF